MSARRRTVVRARPEPGRVDRPGKHRGGSGEKRWSCFVGQLEGLVKVYSVSSIGPRIGTVVFFALRGFFSDLGSTCLIILGVLAVVVMWKAPAGL